MKVLTPALTVRLLWALAAIGYVLRLVIWWNTEGSNDIRTWHQFGALVSSLGLGQTYLVQPYFNHPPLMGLWGAVAHGFQVGSGDSLAFARLFKLPCVLAEFAIGGLLFTIWKERGCSRLAPAAVAAYALSLCSILISAYHGNTDTLYFFLTLLAAYFLETRQRPFLCGLSLGMAINVKLIPILLIAPLAARCRDGKQLLRYAAGGLVAALPFAVAYASFSSPQREKFLTNLFAYRSELEFWGIELWLRSLRLTAGTRLPGLEQALGNFGHWYLINGGKILFFLSLVFAAWLALFARRSFDAYRVVAVCFAGFLVAASGFGVQYVGCVVAPLLAFWLFGGSLVGFATGAFILHVYTLYVVTWSPTFSQHDHYPAAISGLAALAWMSTVYVLQRMLRHTNNRSVRSHDGIGYPGADVGRNGHDSERRL